MTDALELKPGSKTSWSREITEEDVRRFTEVSGDAGRHHVKKDEKGRLMAHGLLVATLPTKLGGDMHYIARTMRFDFIKPAYSGDRLTCTGTVLDVLAKPGRKKVRLSFRVENQDGVLVLNGETNGVIYDTPA